MINTIYADLLTATGTIVHGCNAQGVMNSGVAKVIREKWPGAYAVYREMYEVDPVNIRPGTLSIYTVSDDLVVINAVTQGRYGYHGEKYTLYDAVDTCFASIAKLHDELPGPDLKSINFPLIGCGLGGGHWAVVREIIDYRLPDDKFTKNLYIK